MRVVTPRSILWAALLCASIAASALIYSCAQQHFYKRAYPLEYIGIVREHNTYAGLPDALVMAVIRTESGFDPSAESSVGARGLMQITEDTFEWAKWRGAGSQEDGYDSLFEPEKNIAYGMYILASHIREYGSVELALCAYHAGRGNVNRWLSDTRYSPDGGSLSNIPFGDTNRYVRKVEDTMKIYRALYETLR